MQTKQFSVVSRVAPNRSDLSMTDSHVYNSSTIIPDQNNTLNLRVVVTLAKEYGYTNSSIKLFNLVKPAGSTVTVNGVNMLDNGTQGNTILSQISISVSGIYTSNRTIVFSAPGSYSFNVGFFDSTN
jgi:hypothetical protein